MGTGLKPFLAALVFCPAAALASGYYFGENGTKALMQGGAFTAQADDLTAVQHNPAGLSQLSGFHALLDGQLLSHDVRFLRSDARARPEEARNQAGLFFLPNLGVGYGLKALDRPLTFAFAVYGPPSVGRYKFEAPNYERNERGEFVRSPVKHSPQRYMLIENDIIIAYPTLSVAYGPTDWLSAGISLQYVYSSVTFSQAVWNAPFTPSDALNENPAFDSLVQGHMVGGAFTGVLGVLVRPNERIAVGASVRPGFAIKGSGKLEVTRFSEAAQSLNASVNGDQAELSFRLPLEARLGVRVTPTPAFGINVDGVYQHWQSVERFVLRPIDMTQQSDFTQQQPEALEPTIIPRHWRSTWSARLGGEYALPMGLTPRAGVMFETGASPTAYMNVDFVHLSRVFLTAGLGYQAGPVELLLAGAYTPYQSVTVTDSEVRAGATDPKVVGGVVGNGEYVSGGWIATAGVRLHFGGNR